MAKRMLIDANHPEETRVVVLSGKRIEEFDYETAARSQLKGNIYLAKITRVEPSLQAAFVEYGGTRHGFLPFSEIHPDYYRIPIADREALAAEEAALRGASLAEDEPEGEGDEEESGNGNAPPAELAESGPEDGEEPANGANGIGEEDAPEADGRAVEEVEVESRVDTVGGDEMDEQRRRRASLLRRYKIQEVIKRRQVILVQVSKEERGTKGAALTTYLSLAGRYCVLMPNTARGGGISRKIGSVNDRRRLKKILADLKIPDGMAVIVRTAGAQRSKAEIRRDYEYLMRLWDEIRKNTLQSTAPSLIHEEANLIKRSIRDLYSRDMDEVLVEGEDGYKAAKAFMKSLMPSHARHVQQYKDSNVPIFHNFQVENQLDAMHSPVVQLKSGGYIVLNQTEALVAIDVNSGRATRERHIEVTALKTNLEAAEEVARQLRLRDLAGLVVVDFIDMEESRHNRDVERKLKEAMRSDRARIQLGRLSPFGLLELSRQRLRPSLVESSTVICPRCGGNGYVRSVTSSALGALRALEEEGLKSRDAEIRVSVPTPVALHLLNELRGRLNEVEQRYGFRVTVATDDGLVTDIYRLERTTPLAAGEGEAERAEDESGRKRRRRGRRRKGAEEDGAEAARSPAEEELPAEALEAAEEAGPEGEDGKKGRRRRGKRGGRRRSRRRGEGQGEERAAEAAESQESTESPEAEEAAVEHDLPDAPEASESAEAGDGAEAAPEAGEAAAGEQPKARRQRRPRRRRSDQAAPGEPADDAAGVSPAEEAAETAASADDAQPEEQPDETPARRARKSSEGPRRRRKPAEQAGDGEDAAPEPKAAETAPAPDEAGSEQPPGGPNLPAAAAPVEGGHAERGEGFDDGPGGEAHGSGSGEPGGEDDPDQPKRRGWWQRWV